MIDKINAIYIYSKGRPECPTASYLNKIDYTGDWYICCQEDDETLPEYIENFGEDKIITYNYMDIFNNYTDIMDNYAFKPFGASPARNATILIAHKNGEKRFWFADDDLSGFKKPTKHSQSSTDVIKTGERLEKELYKIAELGYKCNIEKISGISEIGTFPPPIDEVRFCVLNFFNCKTNTNLLYHGRVHDDALTSYLTYHNPGSIEVEISTLRKTKNIRYKDIAFNKKVGGGNKELYEQIDEFFIFAYYPLINPYINIRLKNGKITKTNNFRIYSPKIISDEWKKHEN